jgi:hypothetical protein
MLRSILILFGLIVPVILNANPFVGKWKLDLVGASSPFIVEFVDDSTYSLLEVNVNRQRNLDYSIDEKNQIIHLGKINNAGDWDVRYSFDTSLDSFSLFFKNDFLENLLLESFGFSSQERTAASPAPTQFTKDFVTKLKKGVVVLFKNLPIAVANRIK